MNIKIVILFLLLILQANSIFAKDLHWENFKVEAFLDEQGFLHISESQTIEFNGDWNGGERIFKLFPGQDLEFEKMTKTTNLGVTTELLSGNLNDVDTYKWVASNHLRWRSRLPSDPAFNKEKITYTLYYFYKNILNKSGDGLVLNHDFAFAERDGVINNFELKLSFHPVWKKNDIYEKKSELWPGESVVLSFDLPFNGNVSTNNNYTYRNDKNSYLIYSASLILLLIFLYFKRESNLGRFTSSNQFQVDENFIKDFLLKYKPEIVGVLWDETSNSIELAAFLSRMIQEGKMSWKMEKVEWPYPISLLLKNSKEIVFELNGPKEVDLTSYERSILDGIFPGGMSKSSKSILRKYYLKKNRSFNPVALMVKGLEKTIAKDKILKELDAPSVFHLAFWSSMLLSLAGFVYNFIFYKEELAEYFIGLVILIFAVVSVSRGIVSFLKTIIGNAIGSVFAVTCGLGLVACLFNYYFYMFESFHESLFYSLMLFHFSLSVLLWWVFSSKSTLERNEIRSKLIAIRKYFKNELLRQKPNIADSWFPYLVALELDKNMDKWRRIFSGVSSQNISRGHTHHFGSSGGQSSWSGGGGTFAGAGASGSWSNGALPASAFVASVAGMSATASSSSSRGGSSGGGGGGSSGGGGGGGW